MEIEPEMQMESMEIDRELEAAFMDSEDGAPSDVLVEEVLDSFGEGSCESESTEPQLVNVVISFSVGCPVDLKQIAMKARNVEYNPRRFTALIMRIREPKTTALIFPRGKLIVTGAKSEADAKLACRKYARILQKLSYPVQMLEYKVVNMVGLLRMPFKINLIMLNAGKYRCTKYEPELFPGLIYKISQPKVTVLVFQSGKAVFLGIASKEALQRASEIIYPDLIRYKRLEPVNNK